MIFQESGVTFNNVKKIGTKISSFPVGNPDNYEYEENSLSRKDTEHIENKGGFVNAIDIDWDGVEVETISPDCGIQILNTTSDLLNWIKCLENRISALEGGGGGNVRPIDPDDYRITWNDNGATTAHYGGSDFVYPGETVVLPTTNPIRRYNITWSANGGSGTISGGTTKVTYTFNNWWTTTSGGIQVTSSTIPTGDATYYAHWTAPTSIILPTTNPTRSGYTFKGWATTSSATTPNVTSSTIPTGDVTYYAVWQIQGVDPVTQYTVTFNGNGGTISGNSTRTVNAGNPIGIFPSVTYSGHELTKWTYSNGNTANSTDIVNSNITIYAQWQEVTPVVTQYTVTYHSNGGNSTPAPQTVNAGQTITLASAISRNADSSYTYTFAGWNTNSNGTGTNYNAGASYTVNGNINLYAKWNRTAITPVTTDYYWYVGTTVPTDPTSTTQNTGLNKWTSLGTTLPTSSIQVNKVDTSYNFSTWYIAAPTAANFILYNATNVASNEAGWNKTTFNVGSVSYTLWTSKATSYQAVGYLHK